MLLLLIFLLETLSCFLLSPLNKALDISKVRYNLKIYIVVPAATYSLSVRVSGTSTIVLTPSVNLAAGFAYTIFAEGLVSGSGDQALTAVQAFDSLCSIE